MNDQERGLIEEFAQKRKDDDFVPEQSSRPLEQNQGGFFDRLKHAFS